MLRKNEMGYKSIFGYDSHSTSIWWLYRQDYGCPGKLRPGKPRPGKLRTGKLYRPGKPRLGKLFCFITEQTIYSISNTRDLRAR